MRTLPRWSGALTAGFVAAVSIAGSAAAHVHVDVDGGAVAGQPALLMLGVPNERPDAATVAIEVQMPREGDVVDVVPAEVEGWTISTRRRDGDIVDTIRWEATGPGLTGDESVTLPVAVGPLPDVATLTFPTVQTYDDGEIVRWIEPAPAGEAEPELPVPTLEVSPAAPGDTTPPTAPPTEPTDPSTTAAEPTEPTAVSVPTEPTAAPATEPTAPDASLVIAPAPTDTVTATSTAADDDADDDGDDDTIWPWVVGGIVIVVVGGGTAAAVARRRTSP